MPEIAKIKGIIIYMYFRDHEPSHVHAITGDTEGMFNILTGMMEEGNSSKSTQKIVKEWILDHTEELQRQWITKDIKKIK